MRNAVTGLLVGVVLTALVAGGSSRSNPAQAQGTNRGPSADGELRIVSWEANNSQHLAVIDARSRVLGIYEVNRSSGAITLRSVRNIHWDLQMEEFNSTNPSPREIRAILERR